MRHPVLRYGAAALCVLGAVYFLLPLSMGVLHIGMLYPAAGLLLAAVWLVFPGLFQQWPRWLRRTVCVVLAAGLLMTQRHWRGLVRAVKGEERRALRKKGEKT